MRRTAMGCAATNASSEIIGDHWHSCRRQVMRNPPVTRWVSFFIFKYSNWRISRSLFTRGEPRSRSNPSCSKGPESNLVKDAGSVRGIVPTETFHRSKSNV